MAAAGSRNVRTSDYKGLLAKLPTEIQELAEDGFKLFCEDPLHPMLHNHPLSNIKKSQHRDGSRAVWITHRYRAIYFVDGDTNVWYWCGSHSDYNTFTGNVK